MGVSHGTETLLPDFLTLVGSFRNINPTCNTTTVVVFKMSCTYILESYLLVLTQVSLLQNFYIYITKQSQRLTYGGLLLLCWPGECKRPWMSFSVPIWMKHPC